MATISFISETVEMYLKSIAELELLTTPVAISQLAQRLGVSSPSVLEMVKRLAEQKLVTHTPYKGVALTAHGHSRALAVLRRHRLWERFLVDTLRLPWEEVHDYACQLEHAAAPAVVDALAQFLGEPNTCPHGNPIPDATGAMPTNAAIPLLAMEVGQSARLTNIIYEESILLEYLARRGLFPGAMLMLEDVAPYQGPLMVRVDGSEHPAALGREIAARVFVQVIK